MLDMKFFHRAVKILEVIVEVMKKLKNSYPYPTNNYHTMTMRYPEFTKHMVRVKKHVRPPVRAEPEITFYLKVF